MEWVCGVGVRQGLSGASVPRSRPAMHEKINVFNILHKSSLFYVFK